MRRQYYFRPSAHGFDAWDVDRLIRLTTGLPVLEVALDDLEDLDTPYWFGSDGAPLTVRRIVDHMRLVHDVDPAHPIILAADGRVMDGMHRVARALLERRTSVAAVRFEVQPDPDHRDCRPEDLDYD